MNPVLAVWNTYISLNYPTFLSTLRLFLWEICNVIQFSFCHILVNVESAKFM